jgi:hypothetical protein
LRAYIRVDPELPDHKEHYPDGAVAAFAFTMCFAEHQPRRGRFKNSRVLSALLGRRARWIRFLIEHGDLIEGAKGELYFDGWDEWQEGDWKVGERVKRIRARPRNVTPPVTVPVTVAPVITPSERIADSGKPQAVSGEPLAAPPTPSAVKAGLSDAIQNGHTDDLSLQLAARVTDDVMKRPLSALDVALCEMFIAEFAYLGVDDIVERMKSQVEWGRMQKPPMTPSSLAWFTQSLRNENDHRADAGQGKAWRPPPVAGDLSKLGGQP